eukprot:399603_1
MLPFEGNLAVITGAAHGIGKSIAINLATKGCNMALLDINSNVLHQVTNSLSQLFTSIKVYGFVCDVSKEDSIKSIIPNIKSSFHTDRIQLLFNNAGIGAIGVHSVLSDDINISKKIMDVNLWSMIYCTRLFMPMLLSNHNNKPCYIINTGSATSLMSGMSMYSITKHAVITLSETIREELKRYYPKHNILVSTLCPGVVETNFWKNSKHILQMEKSGRHLPVKQMRSSEVANIAIEGLKNRKVLIYPDVEFCKCAIEDRMNALLSKVHDNTPKTKRYMLQQIMNYRTKNAKL